MADPDSGGPKTYGSYGSGSITLPFSAINLNLTACLKNSQQFAIFYFYTVPGTHCLYVFQPLQNLRASFVKYNMFTATAPTYLDNFQIKPVSETLKIKESVNFET